MSTATLSVSRLIKVAVSLEAQAAQAEATNTMLLLGSAPVVDTSTRFRAYSSLAAVAADFGTSAPEYLAAVLWFEQNPQPIGPTLLIGRWATTDTKSHLFGGVLSAAEQSITNFNLIADGGFKITIDGVERDITGVDLTAATNLNAVAGYITTALGGPVVTWNNTQKRFELASSTTGETSTLSFAEPPDDLSTDLSLRLGWQSSQGGYVSDGTDAETALEAVALFDQYYGQKWFGLHMLNIADADAPGVADYIEASENKHYFFASTIDPNTLVAENTSSLAYILSQKHLNFTGIQYSSTNPYAVVSMAARILTTNYAGNNTTITLMYKQEPGIVPENLTETQAQALEAVNCNVIAAYSNSTAIIQRGRSSSGIPIDTAIGSAAFAIALQTALFNRLYTTTTKIPQTDAGMHVLGTDIENVCDQFVNNGFLAPGFWNSSAWAGVKTGDFVQKGYNVYIPAIASQSQADRANRISVPFEVAAKLAGAVELVDLSVVVNT